MSVFTPNGHDLAGLRRWLDDLQFKGSDLATIEKWRALLDAFDSVGQICELTSGLTGDLERTVDRIEGVPENADIAIDIGGTLDDLESDTLAASERISPAVRRVIEEAITKANKEAAARLEKLIAEEVTDARKTIGDLDDPKATLEKRAAEERARHEKRESKRGHRR